MKTVVEETVPLRTRALSLRQILSCLLVYLWDVYSKAVPSGREIVCLMSLCFLLAAITGGLLHWWLSDTLKYEHAASVQTACFYSVCMLPASFLCHPLRCVLTLILPTACTKQGRKLLVSASVMVLVLNVVPNISANVGAVARILKCTAEGFTRTLLNSTEPFNRAKNDLMKEAMEVWREDLSVVSHLRHLDHYTHIDVSEVRSTFVHLISQIEANFSHAKDLLKEYKLLSNRILAAVFVALLVVESVRYLKSYLMSVRFDNGFISEALRHKNSQDGPKICRVTSQECASCFISLVVVTIYFLAITLIVVLDHVVYHIVQMIVPWLMDLPPTTASISVSYQVTYFPPGLCIIPQACVTRELTDFHKVYSWTFDPEPLLCNVTASAPSHGVSLLLGGLWMMSYLLVFLELYARRLRRQVCISFFREQEERRKAHLTRKILEKEKKKNNQENITIKICGSE
ncbi:osteoclast stimulatory transmembrane protein [Nematolebias whitei]|uniref:osteoclast stimulatory transmembrane protein n=1 Tax=Nematolebias whitei TaxID=451745 RepID=UPI00189A5A31|nr:osteoclast stimulatory transmembrane protein [Nematolebias whitei]